MTDTLSINVRRFDGMAACYDAHRGKPPEAFLDRITRLIEVDKPKLVVDLGCGTGLSTGIWTGRAETVIGIDPNKDMIGLARNKSSSNGHNLQYLTRFSHETGLPNGCADIVTAFQSVQYMEPQRTIDEVVRILRPGGVFAIAEAYRTPMLHQDAEKAYAQFIDKLIELCNADQDQLPENDVDAVCWSKKEHVDYMRRSNQFRCFTECLIEATETGNAERLVGLARSQSGTFRLRKRGFTEKEIGLDELRIAAQHFLGEGDSQWRFIFHVVFAIK